MDLISDISVSKNNCYKILQEVLSGHLLTPFKRKIHVIKSIIEKLLLKADDIDDQDLERREDRYFLYFLFFIMLWAMETNIKYRCLKWHSPLLYMDSKVDLTLTNPVFLSTYFHYQWWKAWSSFSLILYSRYSDHF